MKNDSTSTQSSSEEDNKEDDFMIRAQRASEKILGAAAVVTKSTGTSGKSLLTVKEDTPSTPLFSKDDATYWVDQDVPKIDSALKSYMSLVVARNLTSSTLDCHSPVQRLDSTMSEIDASSQSQQPLRLSSKEALICARTLLKAINSYKMDIDVIPPDDGSEDNDDDKDDEVCFKKRQQNQTLCTLWNASVTSSSSSNHTITTKTETKKVVKPSIIFGRRALMEIFDDILQQIQTNVQQTISDPKATDNDLLISPQILDFVKEFYTLTKRRMELDDAPERNDSMMDSDARLIWSLDQGKAEVARRQELRQKEANQRIQDSTNNIDTKKAHDALVDVMSTIQE